MEVQREDTHPLLEDSCSGMGIVNPVVVIRKWFQGWRERASKSPVWCENARSVRVPGGARGSAVSGPVPGGPAGCRAPSVPRCEVLHGLSLHDTLHLNANKPAVMSTS